MLVSQLAEKLTALRRLSDGVFGSRAARRAVCLTVSSLAQTTTHSVAIRLHNLVISDLGQSSRRDPQKIALWCALLLLYTTIVADAHVGSPDTFFDGRAGPYSFFVAIEVPQAIPGVAQMQIRSRASDVSSIKVNVATVSGAPAGYPPMSDVLRRSPDDSRLFTGNLPLVEPGEMQVKLAIKGTKGEASLSIPFASGARQSSTMDWKVGAFLCVLMSFLAAVGFAIVAACMRQATLKPREDSLRRKRVDFETVAVVAVAMVFCICIVAWTWWSVAARIYALNVPALKPRSLSLKIQSDGNLLISMPRLTRPGAERNASMTAEALLPDHGHLMHLFLIHSLRLDEFFHLHPWRLSGNQFIQKLPTGSNGSYEVFADVVDATGLSWTLIGQVIVPNNTYHSLEHDDSGARLAPLSNSSVDTVRADLPDGCRVIWERSLAPLRARVPMILKFRVENPNGELVHDLEPYMEMAAHVAIVRSDFRVFAHLHPSGSISMASLELVSPHQNGSSNEMPGMIMPTTPISPEISIPYGFPEAGLYRLFLQIRHRRVIETATFDAKVIP
jgi:hypothetical protein